MKLTTLGVLLAMVLLAPGAQADVIDDARKLPTDQAIPALERLLDAAPRGGAEERRIRQGLADIHQAAGDRLSALPHLEALVRLAKEDGPARVAYAATLLAVAKDNIAAGSMGRKVNPFLRDAIDALRLLPVVRTPRWDEPTRARLVSVLVEARYRLQETNEALAVLAQAKIESLPASARRPLYDLEGRLHYVQKAWEPAAKAFLASGHPIGAAAAWDAARRPDKSMPLYAAAVRASPESAGVLQRALGAVRFHKSHAALLDALDGLPTPAAEAGVPLLFARAELLEGVGRIPEALPLLEDAAARVPSDSRALVALGRLRGVLAMSGDAVDETLLDQSADDYVRAIERTPTSEAAAGGLSWLASRDYSRLWKAWRDERIRTRCLRVQRALAAAQPDDAWAWANLGNTLRILGNTAEALDCYTKAREANPYDPGVRSDEGLALAAAGRAEASLASYLESLRLDPGHLAGRQNAARALYLQGNDAEAARHLGEATRTARAIGRGPMTYRFLVDRTWRAGRRPDVR